MDPKINAEKWVDDYSDYLYHYTIKRVNDSHLAKDLIQETFLSALKSLANFRGESHERTWLTSILKRKIIDHYRKKKSAKGQAEIQVNFHEGGENKGKWLEKCVPQSWGNDAETTIENTELGNVLDQCIDHLPEKYATVFRMRTIHNIATEDICNEFNTTSSNLWVMIHKARAQLRRCLENNWFNK